MIRIAVMWLAARAPSQPDPPAFDLSYTQIFTVAPSDPDVRARFPCPEGSEVGGIPIIDCDGEVVCPTRILGCWKDRYLSDGLVVAWHGEQKIDERMMVDGRPDGPYAAWWSDGRLRALGTFASGAQVGPWHEWEADGSRVSRVKDADSRTTWVFSPSGILLREMSWSDVYDEVSIMRTWWESGHPRDVLLDPRAPAGTVTAAWDEAGRPIRAWHTVRGRPAGRAFVWTGDGYAVERWRDGQLVDVRLPRGFEPASGALACPRGAWVERDELQGEVTLGCTTLSGFALGPSRTTRTDGSISWQMETGPDGRYRETGWCRNGSIWFQRSSDGPDEVNVDCPK